MLRLGFAFKSLGGPFPRLNLSFHTSAFVYADSSQKQNVLHQEAYFVDYGDHSKARLRRSNVLRLIILSVFAVYD